MFSLDFVFFCEAMVAAASLDGFQFEILSFNGRIGSLKFSLLVLKTKRFVTCILFKKIQLFILCLQIRTFKELNKYCIFFMLQIFYS